MNWRPWLLAARPRTLSAALVPVMVGVALAVRDGRFHLLVFLATLAVALLLQIGANFANDVFDFMKGADVARRGPTRVTQSGLLSVNQMLAGTGVVFGAAALIGLYLVYVGGWPLLVVGALAIVSALAYTGGPWPLGYHGLGDLFVFVFFGLVAVIGSYYLQTGAVTLLSVLVAIPIGLLITSILVVNNLRDIETDRAAGKRTLAVRIGERATRAQFAFCVFGAYVINLSLYATLGAALLLPLLSLPLAVRLVRDVLRTRDAPVFNRLLARTAQFNLIFGVLLALGLLLSTLSMPVQLL